MVIAAPAPLATMELTVSTVLWRVSILRASMEAHAWKKNKEPATLVFALLVSRGQTVKKK